MYAMEEQSIYTNVLLQIWENCFVSRKLIHTTNAALNKNVNIAPALISFPGKVPLSTFIPLAFSPVPYQSYFIQVSEPAHIYCR